MNDPELWIVAAIVLAFIFSVIDFVRRQNGPEDPDAVRRRCRLSLRSIREDLERLPAGRDVHSMLEQKAGGEEALLPENAARFN